MADQIEVMINGENQKIEQGLSLSELLEKLGYGDQSFAIAVNETFVPRSQYQQTSLQAEDVIEIVAPMQGG